MEKMNDLKDLLKHEIQDLYSAEEQIIKAMPAMIQKANSWDLKKALEEHLNITKRQLIRIEQAQRIVNEESENNTEKKTGLLSRLFRRNQVCKGMQGIIEEGEKVMSEEMTPEVLDAAIIACAQKIEHYEICGYGTARAYAKELNLEQIAGLLQETLDEEYNADDRLTKLAVERLNKKAENTSPAKRRSSNPARTQQERTPVRETEMELVINKERTATNGGRKNVEKSTAPKGTNPERGEHSSRNASTKRGTTSKTKTTGKSSGRSGSKSGAGRGDISRTDETREQ